MKKIYRDILFPALVTYIPEKLQGFSLFKPITPRKDKERSAMGRGGTYFRKEYLPNTSIFLTFWALERDIFELDIGWSAKGRFPFDVDRPSLWALPPDLKFADEGWIGLGTLIQATEGVSWDGWRVWKCSVPPLHPDYRSIYVKESLLPVSKEDAAKRVDSVIQTVFRDLNKYVEPFIDLIGCQLSETKKL